MSTTTAVVPASVQLAAKRGFVRTTAQAYASTIPAGGVSAAALISLVHSPDPVVLACMAIAAVVSPPLAGFASWLSILSKGLPADYTAVVSATAAAPKPVDSSAPAPAISWPPTSAAQQVPAVDTAPASATPPAVVAPPAAVPAVADATAGSTLAPPPVTEPAGASAPTVGA